MSRCIGVVNYKGGTGKTTTVVNLSAGLALRGERVLCVDLDAQGSLATCLGVNYVHSLAHMLLGQAEPPACVVNARDNLDLIASDGSLLRIERDMWRMDDRTAWQILGDKISAVEDEYDYIIFDFSPSPGLLGESGLRYISELIVPVSMSYMAMVGARQALQTLKDIRRTGHRAWLYLIVPTLYSAQQRQDREVLEILRRHFAGKVTRPIRKNVKLTEAPSHHMTIYEYAHHSSGAIDYDNLVERVIRDA